jgi:hypothetical protein
MNRIHNLFQSLSSILAPTRYKGSFRESITEPYTREAIQNDHKPYWMRDEFQHQRSADQTSISVQAQSPPSLTFILVWIETRITKYTDDLNAHINEYVNRNLLNMPARASANKDPRVYLNGGQWRDEMRRQLNLPNLWLISEVLT